MRAVVIGVGAMGRNHARVYAELDEVELVAVADLNQTLVERTSSKFGVRGYCDYRIMLEKEKPDLASIVVPTREHLRVARDAIERGVHILVEKPIASTITEGQEIVRLAEQHDVQLCVGHIERFNPAIIELKRRLDQGQLGRIFKIHARRLGPFPPRVRDVGVVIDLATHDLDIMSCLTNTSVERIYAETERRIHTEYEDLLMGLLRFTDGTLGVLDINWLTPTKIRELIVTGERGMFIANYLSQELRFYQNNHASQNPQFYQNNHIETKWGPSDTVGGISEGDMIKYRIGQCEPLKEELRTFVNAVMQMQLPTVSGWDGLLALALAQKVIESSQIHQTLLLAQGGEFNESSGHRIGQNWLAVGSTIRV